MLTDEQVFKLSQGDELTAQIVMTIDVLSDALKNHAARIKKLEAREQETAKPSLRVVNDGP